MNKLLIVCLSIYSFSAMANENVAEKIKAECTKEITNFDKPKEVLVPLYNEVVKFNYNTCIALNTDDIKAASDQNFLTGGMHNRTKSELLNFLTLSFTKEAFPEVEEAKLLWNNYEFSETLSSDNYELTTAFIAAKQFGFNGPKRRPIRIDWPTDDSDAAKRKALMENECSVNGYADCKSFFTDIHRIGNFQNHYIRTRYTDETLEGIREKSNAWTKFSDDSRYQTPIDILFTSSLNSKILSDGLNLASPPRLQYFLLHPSIVVDHSSKATSGDKDELGLALEWVGFNSWNSKIPWGVSVASVYADREVGKSVGIGLMFHLYNDFSFGFAHRGDGDNSIYINLELMNWFSEKQNMYKKYKDNL